MTHLNEGILRRLVDEPLAMSDVERTHFQSCDVCRDDVRRMRAEAADVAALFAATVTPQIDPAKRIVRERLGETARRSRPQLSRLKAGGVAAVALLVAVATLTPAGSAAQDLLNIFQPTQVTVVPITSSELQSLPSLADFGTVQMPQPTTQQVSDVAAATSASGLSILTPASLPPSVTDSPRYEVISPATGSFTFSAAKASQAVNGPLPPMPTGLDGSTITVRTGSGVAAMYGAASGIPQLVIGQMRAPTITSDGASIKEIEDYMLSLPGVSPQLADSIRALGDPLQALPLPIPTDKLNSQSITVRGQQGTLVSDPNGLGAVIVWQDGNTIYGVGGPLSSDQLLAIANGLH